MIFVGFDYLLYIIGFSIGYQYGKKIVDNLIEKNRKKKIKEYNEYLRLVQSYNGNKTWKDLYHEMGEKGWVNFSEWRDFLNEQQKTKETK